MFTCVENYNSEILSLRASNLKLFEQNLQELIICRGKLSLTYAEFKHSIIHSPETQQHGSKTSLTPASLRFPGSNLSWV
jgi:hypothetical protein